MSSQIVEVCKVDNIIKHPNADRLSIVTVKGWNCIVGLDQYKVGDLIVYIPPDYIIPDDLIQRYNLTYLKNGGRTGTLKLRGYVSQGLVLDVPKGDYKLGDDVAKVLGIIKYEPPEPSYQTGQKTITKKKRNPLFDKFTDIENIKNYPHIFQEGEEVVITEKIHGSNWRAGHLPVFTEHKNPLKKLFAKIKSLFTDGYEFVYGSHNVQLTPLKKKKNFYGKDIYGIIAEKYNIKSILPKDYIIYGEVYGIDGTTRVQDLTYGKTELTLAVFALKYKNNYLDWDKVEAFCLEHNLPLAPVLYKGAWSKELLTQYTDGKSIICPEQIREGCVVVAAKEVNDPRIGRKILKSVSVDYLTRDKGKGTATEYH